MRIALWLALLLIVVVAIVAFFGGRATANQVVDADGKSVDGKFISNDGGKTAVAKPKMT